MARTEGPYQLHLGETVPETLYQFYKDTVIYPLCSGRGNLRNPITAEEIQTKRGGLTVYRSLSRIDLYLDGHWWSLPEGSLFAAYSNERHKVTIS